MNENSSTAQKLRSLIAKVLNCHIDDVEDSSDFFTLGGDSVDAMRFVQAAQKHGMRMITMAKVYEIPRVSDLAAWCDIQKSAEEGLDHKSIKLRYTNQPEQSNASANTRRRQPDMMEIVKDWKFVESVIAQTHLSPDLIEDFYPTFSLQESLLGMMYEIIFEFPTSETKRVVAALERIQQSDPMMRTRLVKHEGCVYQVVVREKIHWNEESGSVNDYRICNGRHFMDFGSPLCRFAIVVEGDVSHIVWTICHSITDRPSRIILIERMIKYFQDPSIPTITMPPVRSLIEHVYDPTTQERSMNFWKPRLQTVQHMDHLHPIEKLGRQKNLLEMLKSTPSPSAVLPGIARSTIWHVALAFCLAKLATHKDIFFLTFGSGRNVPGYDNLGDMSGMMVCEVPFRTDLSQSGQPFEEYLRQVQRDLMSGFTHEHYAQTALERTFGPQNCRQVLFSYDTLPEDPEFNVPIRNEDGAEQTLRISVPGHYGWDDPSPSIFLSVHPDGEETQLSAVYDQVLVPKGVIASLLDELVGRVEQLFQAAPWDDMTLGDFAP